MLTEPWSRKLDKHAFKAEKSSINQGLLTERKVLVIVAAVATTLLIGALFVYIQISELQNQIRELKAQNSELQSQNSYLQNRVNQLLEQLGENFSSPVKIVAVEFNQGYPIVGVTLEHSVKVTIKNYAAVNVTGLSLDARLINRSNGNQIDTGSTNINLLQAGETLETWVSVYTNLGTSLVNAACVVTLKSGNTVLDEFTQSVG
jgi:cell division protein FtsL